MAQASVMKIDGVVAQASQLWLSCDGTWFCCQSDYAFLTKPLP